MNVKRIQSESPKGRHRSSEARLATLGLSKESLVHYFKALIFSQYFLIKQKVLGLSGPRRFLDD